MPRRWIAMMKQAMMAIGLAFNANRMVAGYVENFYLAGIERSKALEADNGLRARALAAWKRTLAQAWPEVRIAQIEDDQEGEVEVGSTFSVRVSVSLGGIPPEHVGVELCYGPLDLEGGIRDATIVRMQSTGVAPDQTHQFVGRVVATTAGRQGYTVRVMPSHEDLVRPVDTGLVVWA
jgi:starch phosphorylase